MKSPDHVRDHPWVREYSKDRINALRSAILTHQILILVLNFGGTGSSLHWKREIQMGENIEPRNQEKQMRYKLGKTVVRNGKFKKM